MVSDRPRKVRVAVLSPDPSVIELVPVSLQATATGAPDSAGGIARVIPSAGSGFLYLWKRGQTEANRLPMGSAHPAERERGRPVAESTQRWREAERPEKRT
jgi:hypothetical protein